MTFSTAFQSSAFQNNAFQIVADTARVTSSGSWNKDWGKIYGPERYWTVKAKGKKAKKYKTAEAALTAAANGAVQSIEFAGVDYVAEFRALIARRRADPAWKSRLAAELAALEAHAAHEAAEREDEEVILLLLH